MSAHTPGPWTYDNGEISAPNGRTLIAVDAIGCESESEHAANARLIAAAPDGFYAAQLAIDCAVPIDPVAVEFSPRYIISAGALAALRAFIAKAEGK